MMAREIWLQAGLLVFASGPGVRLLGLSGDLLGGS